MSFSWFHKAVQFIGKDTGEQNESPRLIVVIRALILTMLFYIGIISIVEIDVINKSGIMILSISFIVFLCLFIMTYHSKTKYITFTFNLCMLAWIAFSLLHFGWDTGVQHFILALLILNFFSGYSKYVFKTIYAVALCCFRIFLYFLFHNIEPIIQPDITMIYILQIVNTITIFFAISITAYIFSINSQALEGKLIDYNNQLIKQANTDALTGLYNRRKAMNYLEKLLASGNQSSICFCICDIDFFKKVNDNYGHDVGDVVLQKISQTMQETVGNTCFIARWGGEEFLLVFPNCNGDESFVLLNSLRHQIKALKFDADGKTFSITMTFGLAEYDFQSDVDTIIKEADEKLYRGKENGRDQIVF